MKDSALPALEKNKTNGDKCKVSNHEYLTGTYSTIYKSRNRVRSWDEPSFTIQAGGRHAPIQPQAPKMIEVDKINEFLNQGKKIFIEDYQFANVQEFKYFLMILNFIITI